MSLVSAQTMSDVICSFEAENKRIATELHEGFAQTLYSVYSGLQFIETNTEDEGFCQYIKQMTSMIERTIVDLRWLSTDLHPASLDKQGVYSALKAYANIFEKTFGIEIQLRSQGQENRFPAFIEIMMFRICQETLRVAGHDSDTEQITILFDWNASNVIISFFINGTGTITSQTNHFKMEMNIVKAKALLINGEVKQSIIKEMEMLIKITIPYNSEVGVYDKDLISG